MFHIHANITDIDGCAEQLDGMSQRARRKRPAFDAINVAFARHSHDLFTSQGASGASGRWPGFAPSTLRTPGRKGPMRVSDDLYRSLATPHGSGRVYQADNDEITALGTKVEYAQLHHEGRGRLPVRKLIDITDAQEGEYRRLLEHHVEEGLE